MRTEVLVAPPGFATRQSAGQAEVPASGQAGASPEELNKQLNDPVSSVWSLNFQNDFHLPDISFGPRAPQGPGTNWLRTVPGKGFFVILRLYGPTQPFFAQTWKPGDLEKAQ